MNELALFAGAGGGILGGKLLGWRTVCAVEWEPYPASVLCARQNDGFLPPFPVWDDIQTFDGKPWRGIVDVISGGFPCQDISAAGRGDGLDGKRSGMWHHMARVVGEIRPSFVFVENSPMLTSRGGTRVIADLTALGYDCRWTVMGAADVGANHQRDRMWIVAYSASARRNEGNLRFQGKNGCTSSERASTVFEQSSKTPSPMAYTNGMRELQQKGRKQDQWGWIGNSGIKLADADSQRQPGQQRSAAPRQAGAIGGCSEEVSDTVEQGLQKWIGGKESAWSLSTFEQRNWWDTEPDVGRVANGVAARVDRLKAIGNGQVPLCAAEAWKLLNDA